MDKSIAVISPSSILTKKILGEIKKRNLNIFVKQAFTEEALNEAEELILKGTRVIISRGHTASVLRENLDIPVVDVRHTFFDCYIAYKKAKNISDNIVFLASSKGFENMLQRSKEFLHGIKIMPIDLNENEKGIDEKLRKLQDNGIEVAIGGLTLKSKIEKLGIEYIMSEADEEAINQALEESFHLARIELEKEERRKELENKYEIINSILNSVSDGVISYDKNGVINNVNYKAKKILGENIIEKNAKEFIPTELFKKSIDKGKKIENEIIYINQISLVLNVEPVRVDDNVIGSVATFQKSKQIQKADQKIRESMLQKGHIAEVRFEDILGESKEINHTKEIAKKYAKTNGTILIFGETGTGKELFAQSIHNHSNRSDKPFIAINLSAFPQDLLESELFGYVKGAFTGALNEGKAGIFELAHGGTIFLDEISEVPLDVQIKLLRIIQERKIVRIGDDKIVPIDVRIIAATNKDLREQVDKKLFREDLYYRICVLELRIPKLKERKEDIPYLIHYFMGKSKIPINLITNKAVNILKEAEWPGNVRQLNNIVERLIIMSNDGIIDSEMVSSVLNYKHKSKINNKVLIDENVSQIKKTISEEELIKNALIQTNGNRKATADILGISVTTLWRRINKYDSIDKDFLEKIKYKNIDI